MEDGWNEATELLPMTRSSSLPPDEATAKILGYRPAQSAAFIRATLSELMSNSGGRFRTRVRLRTYRALQ